MAVTQCKECRHQISTTARTCPNCGAKVPRTKRLVALGALGCAKLLDKLRANKKEQPR